MKYYNELLKIGPFSKQQVNELLGNPETAKSLLHNYLANGLIMRIRHNYYVIKSLETNQPAFDRFTIASNINKGAYVSHHSAFEYYGMANQVFTEIYVSSNIFFTDFEFDGINYHYIKSKTDIGVIQTGSHVKITDIERTIIDSIKDFTRIGGLEELLRCLSMVTFVDQNKLIMYLTEYDNQFLYQKTGYVLSHFKADMKIKDDFFEVCRANIKKSVRYLYSEIKNETPKFNPEWQLLVPGNLLKLLDEGGDEFV